MRDHRRLLIGLVILALLTPIGLLIPECFGAGAAWGEWGTDEIKELVGFVPAQMARLSTLWTAPMPDYAIPGQEDAGLGRRSVFYVFSALAGIASVYVLSLGLGRLLKNKEETDAS